MRGDGGNHHAKLGLKRIMHANQLTIPDTADTTPDPECNYTNMRSSQRNQTRRTPDFSYLLASSTSFSSASPISLFHVHNSTIIAEHKGRSSLPVSPCHDHQLTPSTAYTEYKNTVSTAYTEYKNTVSTAYTEYSIHWRLFVFPPFSWFQVDPWIYLQHLACLPTRSTAISQLPMRAQR